MRILLTVLNSTPRVLKREFVELSGVLLIGDHLLYSFDFNV